MSHRPAEQKRRRKVAKAFRRAPLPAFIDPIEWLLQHGHAKTRREARALVLAKRLKSESHTVGVEEGYVWDGLAAKPGDVVGLVPAEYRKTLHVVA